MVSPYDQTLFMYFHTAKCLDESGILMVYNFAVPQIFLGDLFHFILSQAEIPDIYVLLHPLHMNRFRDDGYPTLGIPAKYDLGSALTVFLTDLGQFRICENTMFASWAKKGCSSTWFTAGMTSTFSQRLARIAG